MKAAVVRRFGGPEVLEVEDVADPFPADHEMLVAVAACGVCGHDLLARRGLLGTRLPAILGHEISGTVEAVGPGVSGFAVGDRVALVQRDPCGQCDTCLRGAENLCKSGCGFYGEDRPGGYAEYVLATPSNAVHLPPQIDLAAGAVLSCALGTGWHALRRVRATPGEVVLVTGAGGGVGLHALQLCRHLGAHAIAVTSSPGKREALLQQGAEHVVVLAQGSPSLRDQVRQLTGGALADVVLEVAGPPTFRQSLSALAPQGRLALIGNVDPQDVPLTPGLMILKELSVVGSAHGTRDDLAEVVELVAAGHVKPVVAEEIPLSEVARSHAPPTRDTIGRRLIRPGV